MVQQSIQYFLVLSSKTAFFKLDNIFPECALYRDQSPRIEPLICLAEDMACTVGHACMDTAVRRLKMLFSEIVPTAELILLYYRKRCVPGIGAGVFWKDFREPRIITVNPKSWERVKFRGVAFQFSPSESFFLSGQSEKPQESQEKQAL